MTNRNITIDSLDTPNPRADHDGPWRIAPRPAPRLTWDVIVARWGMGILAAGAAWWVAPEWAHSYVTAAALGLGTLAGAKHVLTDMIGGVAVRTWRNDVRGSDVVQPLGMAAIEHARRPLPNVSSYSPTLAPATRGPVIEGAVIETPAQLAGPALDIGPLLADQWLTRLDAQPHIIFAAKTKGGKSTMAKFGMQPRIARGETFYVIDPHANGWLDLPSIGGGLRWDEVTNAIVQVTDLYRARQDERRRWLDDQGDELPHDHFPRLNVILDEANETRLMLDKRVWEPFVQVMGSGARKVGISLWLICQSALVKNLGGSEIMRRNFTIFALDHMTIAELIESEESNKVRRECIKERIAGQQFPACMVDNGQAWLLDRTGIDHAPIGSARGLAWQPSRPAAHRAVVAASVRPFATVAASMPVSPAPKPTDGRTDGRTALIQDRALLYLRARIRQGDNRERARTWMEARGLTFQNSLYTEARRLEGR